MMAPDETVMCGGVAVAFRPETSGMKHQFLCVIWRRIPSLREISFDFKSDIILIQRALTGPRDRKGSFKSGTGHAARASANPTP